MTLKERFLSLDPVITGLAAGLTVFGLVMLLSATGPTAIARTGDSLYFVKHQLALGILPGIIGFFFFALLDYRAWKSFAFLALIVTIGLLVLVYIPGVGATYNGARGWVKFGPVSFQPSEFVKLTFLIYLAAWFEKRKAEHVSDFSAGLLPFACTLGAVVVLLILQPDTGSMSVIALTALFLYFISGAPIQWFAGAAALGFGGLYLLIKSSPYRAARFMTFLHPELDPQGIGYHINQAMLAIGSGGLWGLGYGHSRQKYLYLPEVESDSVFAVMAEELGFIFILLFFVAIGVLVWRCFKIAREAPDRFGMFLAAGVGAWLAIQTALNIGSMTGMMPMTGVTLPFVSHGGSAMTMLLCAMGLVAGIPKIKSLHKKL